LIDDWILRGLGSFSTVSTPIIFQNERVMVIGRYPLNKYGGAAYARAVPKGTDPDIRACCTKYFSED